MLMNVLRRITLQDFELLCEQYRDSKTKQKKHNIFRHFDFGEQNLSDYNFDKLHLKNCDFTRSVFSVKYREIQEVHFEYCTFVETNFQYSYFNSCTFTKCLFVNPNTLESDLSTSEFSASLGTPFFKLKLNFDTDITLFLDCHTKQITFNVNKISHCYALERLRESPLHGICTSMGYSEGEISFLFSLIYCLIYPDDYLDYLDFNNQTYQPVDFQLISTTDEKFSYSYSSREQKFILGDTSLKVSTAMSYFNEQLMKEKRSSYKFNLRALCSLSQLVARFLKPDDRNNLLISDGKHIKLRPLSYVDYTISSSDDFLRSLYSVLPNSPVLEFLETRLFDERVFQRLYQLMYKRIEHSNSTERKDTYSSKVTKLRRTNQRLNLMSKRKLRIEYDLVETSLPNLFITRLADESILFAGPGFAYIYTLKDVPKMDNQLPSLYRLFDTFIGTRNAECVATLVDYPKLAPIVDALLLTKSIEQYS